MNRGLPLDYEKLKEGRRKGAWGKNKENDLWPSWRIYSAKRPLQVLDFPRGKIFVPRYSSVETTSETILPFNFCGKKIKGAKIANSHFRHHSKRVVRRSTSPGFNRPISDLKNAVMATPARLCYNGKHQSSRMRAARRSLIAGITSGITSKKVCRKFGVASPIATTLVKYVSFIVDTTWFYCF